ncbi:hypothetical protein Val02_22190 [Virgisporangium aliadipatigenens]|uniref:Uncharacterized protein n=1 Tax=Virgisporangium aliadipatigenens TaxID=741659 RepID=A0A8J3YJL5_9ACTN|nr:hypothetical protein Val02_22190 [Virgisporangium aliadipatigenens]
MAGEPVVLLVACDSFSVVSVYERSSSAASSAPAARWVVSTSDSVERQLVELPLFQPPAGWRVDDAALTGLRPDGRYSAGGLSFRQALPVEFSAEQVRGLASDRVLTARDYRRGRVVSRAAFEKAGKASCA